MTEPATIVFLHDKREISGGETSLLVLWERLDRRRFRPCLAGSHDSPLAAAARRIDVLVLPAEFPRLRRLCGVQAWSQFRSLERQVRPLKPGLLHGNTPATNIAAAWLGWRLSCPAVWHERTLVMPDEWDVDRLLGFLPERILCNSQAVAKRFKGPSRRVRIIYNGVPLDRFTPGAGGELVRRSLGLAPDDIAIGIVGNFSPIKRHELFFEAAARLADNSPALRFLVVGGEVFTDNLGREAALKAEVRRLGLMEQVRFLGVRTDMPAVLDALDIVVSPCEAEACSRALLEAMASGTPVVAVNGGGNPELVLSDRTGLLCPPGDPAALADAIDRLCRDSALRTAMGRAARARAETHFPIERQVRETEEVYRGLLERSRPAHKSHAQ